MSKYPEAPPLSNTMGDDPPPYGFVVPPQPTAPEQIHISVPPQFPMPIQAPPTNQVVRVIHQTVVGPNSQSLQCPACNANITTKVVTDCTAKTHFFALLLCLFGFWPCAFLPYCIDSCKTTSHYCPECEDFIGTYDNC